MGNFKIIMAVIVAIFLGYKFLYKNDHPDVPSNETFLNAIYKSSDPKHESTYQINNCQASKSDIGKQTSYWCNIKVTFKDNARPPLVRDVQFIRTKDGLVPDNF